MEVCRTVVYYFYTEINIILYNLEQGLIDLTCFFVFRGCRDALLHMESDTNTGDVSPMMVDLHTDVADLEAKENQLDLLIANCQKDLKALTEPTNSSTGKKYPLKFNDNTKIYLPHFCILNS